MNAAVCAAAFLIYSMTLKYLLTKEDYVNYYTYMTWDAPDQKRKKIRYYLRQLLINGVFIAVIFYSDLFRVQPMFLYIYGGILLLIVVTQIFTARSNIVKQAEKFTEHDNNQTMFSEKQLEIDDSGIGQKDEFIESKFQWTAFTRKEENDLYYFLFVNTLQAIIIPKRVFKQPEEKARFEKLLSQHLTLDAEISHLLKE